MSRRNLPDRRLIGIKAPFPNRLLGTFIPPQDLSVQGGSRTVPMALMVPPGRISLHPDTCLHARSPRFRVQEVCVSGSRLHRRWLLRTRMVPFRLPLGTSPYGPTPLMQLQCPTSETQRGLISPPAASPCCMSLCRPVVARPGPQQRRDSRMPSACGAVPASAPQRTWHRAASMYT